MMWRRFANFHAPWLAMTKAALAAMMAVCGGCAMHPGFDPLQHLDSALRLSGVQGQGFELALVMPREQRLTGVLWVFLEGDGRPWVHGGRRIAGDPSPQNAIGFDLFEPTPVARAYLSRPCYEGHALDVGCGPILWTSARYGETVVASMSAALNAVAHQSGVRHIVLVGYSGGGAMAYLIAPRVPEVSAVISIAGNLDIAAWTRTHRFLPLTDSYNPATQPPLDRRIVQIVIQGGRDDNVPPDILSAFFARQQPQEIWTYDAADHTCCWQRDWQAIVSRIRARLDPTS
jgi:poly(3-hydroxybutyrate) depolymerase